MTWAWATPLPPTPKLVLMALADIADDQGVCWPSHKTLAFKCTLTDRTIRRMVLLLQTKRLLYVQQRVRKDGSRASNSYRLAIDAHPPGQIVQGGGHEGPGKRSRMTGGMDSTVLPRTTIEPSDEPPPLHSHGPMGYAAPNPIGGSGDDLIFPKGLTPSQSKELRHCLASLAAEAAQKVLDELAGRMAVTAVKNPLRYCMVLVDRMNGGAFLPELGLKIADARQAEVARPKQAPATPAEVVKLPKQIREALERMRSKG
jgi:hypothetical protein